MKANPSILLLQHKQVDKDRWDECIQQAPNGLVYAQSFYLDMMCPGWNALTNTDYSWVLPITSNAKWGINYLYQPAFMQQSGVYVQGNYNTVPWQNILHILKKHYRFWEINFNYDTPEVFSKDYTVVEGTNFVLPLKHSFATLKQKFGNDLLRNIKLSAKHRLVYQQVSDANLAIEAYVAHYSHKMPQVKLQVYHQFKTLIKYAAQKNMVVCRQAVNQQNKLVAIALFLNDGRRLYNLMNTTTPAGRKIGANHFLLNQVIEEFAESNLLFDFEGSDLPGVKAFYENFGAINQPYFKVKYNNLPWPLKLLKR